jgi:flagellar protein FlgJ
MAQPSPAIAVCAQAAQRKWKVPASVQCAQYGVESGWGAHAPGNNPFGMKPRKGMNDPQQLLWTTEWNPKTKKYEKVQQPFRTFPSIALAFDAHAQLIATAPVYAQAMAALPDVNRFIDLMSAHYATDPLYASKIKSIIASNNLHKLDVTA